MLARTIDILGVGVSAVDMSTVLETIDKWISERHSEFVCFRDVHGVMACQKDLELREIHEAAGLVCPDGMPLVWIGRLKGFNEVARVCGPDLMLALCAHSLKKDYRHFFYGGAPGVPEKLAENLRRWFPGLHIAGSYSPPFRPLTEEEDEAVIQMINDTKADMVWIGLSTPKQECWMAAHTGKLTAPVMLGVGAAFDYHAGVIRRAPVWMQKHGLEWFFRLISEPKRLWRRYLVLAPLFIFKIVQQGLVKK